MLIRVLLALTLTLGLASSVLAFGSSESPRQPREYGDALKAIKAGDYGRAVALLERVVAKQPANADAWNNLGYSERHRNHFEKSLMAYQRALAINPDHRGANEYLGELYLQIGSPAQARSQLKKLQALCPRGCEEADDLGKAIRSYEAAHPSG
ncbi:MAG: tetratricopeptide repeat protein [Alphaproteobacteria bacterium]|nr:tetratricopeptide repeat protein [Alphaproteobacteria bacterium]